MRIKKAIMVAHGTTPHLAYTENGQAVFHMGLWP
jgi:hypothetical protein